MIAPRKSIAAVVTALALVSTGCRSDDAAKKDVKDAAQDVKKATKKAGNDVEKTIPGDSDDDGK